jgi:hypothetical protein
VQRRHRLRRHGRALARRSRDSSAPSDSHWLARRRLKAPSGRGSRPSCSAALSVCPGSVAPRYSAATALSAEFQVGVQTLFAPGFSLRSRPWPASPWRDLADSRGGSHLHPEHEQFTVHAPIPHPGVLPSQAQDQGADGTPGAWLTRPPGPGPAACRCTVASCHDVRLAAAVPVLYSATRPEPGVDGRHTPHLDE